MHGFRSLLTLDKYLWELTQPPLRPVPRDWPKDAPTRFHLYPLPERQFIRTFLENAGDHTIFYGDTAGEYHPNLFLLYPENALVETSGGRYIYHIFSLEFDLSSGTLSQPFFESMFDLAGLRRIRIYHPKYRALFQSLSSRDVVPHLYGNSIFQILHPNCGFRNLIYHRRLPLDDYDGFTALLEYLIHSEIWRDHGITILEIESSHDFPRLTNEIGYSTDPAWKFFPYIELPEDRFTRQIYGDQLELEEHIMEMRRLNRIKKKNSGTGRL